MILIKNKKYGDNKILNGNFNADIIGTSPPSNWVHVGNHTSTVVSDGGNQVAEIVATGLGDSSNRMVQFVPGIVQNEILRIEYIARKISGIGTGSIINIMAGFTAGVAFLDNNWKKFNFNYRVEGGTGLQTFTFQSNDINPITFQIDAVVVRSRA